MKKIAAVVLVALLASFVASCGHKAPPRPPEDTKQDKSGPVK